MEPFQDGGRQNTKPEHEFPQPIIEGSHVSQEMNSFPHASGESGISSENCSKLTDGLHSNQMQSYPGYSRGNYSMADQHGGMMSNSLDYNNQNSQYSGQFSHASVRPTYAGVPKSGVVRSGLIHPGVGLIPASYSSSQRMMSSQSLSQSGPTPTLNQLLQTSNSGVRYPGNYSDYSGGQGKFGEFGSGASYLVSQQGWNGNPRSMGPYTQGPVPGTSYRSQGSSLPESRHPSSMNPGPGQGYPHQNHYMNSAMASNAQRYMMGQIRPNHMPSMSGHGFNQQGSGNKKTDEITEPGRENSFVEEDKVEPGINNSEHPTLGGSQSQIVGTSTRPVPSPAGSTGSRSDTPASCSGAQAGSPMPPRPPSSHTEGQNPSSQSQMATQGYSQQMMPPPMTGQMGYPGGSAGKMVGPSMSGSQIPHPYSQYSSQYSQGGFRGQPGIGGMQGVGGSGTVPGSSYPQAAMYNGPNSQMGSCGPNMYNNMMSRGMLGYNTQYNTSSNVPMSSHYGSFSSHMGPGQGPGLGPGPGSGPGPGPGQPTSVSLPVGSVQMMGSQPGQNSMGLSGMGMSHGPPSVPGGKGAQAAAQAALMAAANSAGARIPGRGITSSPRMLGPQGSGPHSPGLLNHMSSNLGNPSLASMSNQIQQITSSSVTASSKNMSPSTSAPIPPHSTNCAPIPTENNVSSNSLSVPSGGCGEPANIMSPLSGSDTQESSRPSSTATPGQTVDVPTSSSDLAVSDSLGSMPNGTDSTSVDSGFHSAADNSEKPSSESTPTHSSSPSNSNPLPSTNGPCDEGYSHESDKVTNTTSSSVPTSLHMSTTTTTVTSASINQTGSTNLSSVSEMQSAGSQTTSSLPMMNSDSYGDNSPPNSTHNGPHFSHPRPHPGMSYPMGANGPSSWGPGVPHPAMQQMGNMPPYNMPPGSMPNHMGPGSMPNHMGLGSMPNHMGPGSMPSHMGPGNVPSHMIPGVPNNMGPGSVPNNMGPGSVPNNMGPGSVPNNMGPGSVPNNMGPGSVPNNMGPGSVPNNMGPGNVPSSMGPGSVPNNMGPGSVPNMGPGSVPNMGPGSVPSSMGPGSVPSNMVPGNVSSNMVPGSVPNHMVPGAVPNMGPGIVPNHMVPGNMPNSMGSGNMPNSMGPGSVPNNMPPGFPGNMHPGNAQNTMPPGNMPNNIPPGAMMNSMNRGNMSVCMQPTGMPGSIPGSVPPGALPNHIPPGSMPGGIPPGSNTSGVNSSSLGPMNATPQKHSAPQSSDDPPEKKKKDEGVMVGAGPSFCEDYENSSSPGWPGMPKASDVTRLFDMGNEMDRRPFLEKLFTFLEGKGTPLTTMPCISKQPLDLYKLYHCVREKGGMVEVNKAKRWKEICAVVNIGTSASAAFTLKKNYIRYLFAFECKIDHGGLDPAPILQEMEAQQERKRESKKRVPSPGEKNRGKKYSSQSSQDAFQQPPTPNSQMMEGFPGGPGMPPPYMQGPDGQMMPAGTGGHGPGLVMPSNMMGHPNMIPSHHGSGPNMMGGAMGPGHGSMMMSSGMPNSGPGHNMMGPQGGMMNSGPMVGPNGMMGPGMHMGPNNFSAGLANTMIGQGPPNSSNSNLGPSPGPTMMSGSNRVSSPMPVTTIGSSMVPPTSITLPSSSTPNSRPPTADSVSVQDPFSDEPSKASSPATFQHRPGGPTPSPTPGGYPSPGPPITSSGSGFGSRPSSTSNPCSSPFPNGPANEQGPSSFRRSSESFQSSTSGSFPSSRPDSAQFPFGHESSSHPAPSFHPASSDPGFTPHFPAQQPPFRPAGPAEAFNNTHPFSSRGPALGPRMTGQEGYGSFPSSQQQPGVRLPMNREGSFSSTAGGFMSQYMEWNGAGGIGQSAYPSPLDSCSDYNMSVREGTPWSPMHAQHAYPPSGVPGSPMGPFGRTPQRGSPNARDKVLGKLQGKSGSMMANSSFPPKKEIVFPDDSVEATQPTLAKRRRLTHKDLGSVEAWRLMMALKSGLLAESTWAIDVLNILLFDDATVTYFNLSHLPGLLEALTEQFRAALIHSFQIMSDKELLGKNKVLFSCPLKDNAPDEGGNEEERRDFFLNLIREGSEASLDKSLYSSNYTSVSRQGKTVAKEQDSADCAVLDAKQWDTSSNFTSGKQHWQKGGGDITQHVVPCMESSVTHKFLTDLFYPRTCRKEAVKEAGHKRKAAMERDCVHKEGGCASCGDGSETLCKKRCLREQPEQISLNGISNKKHSDLARSKEHINNFICKAEKGEVTPEPELHCSKSDDSLKPSVLPAAPQDWDSAKVSGVDGDLKKGDGEEKSAPPDLTREDDREEGGVKGNELPTLSAEKEKGAQEPKKDASSDDASRREDDDEMTAEIVAMMMKEQEGETEEEAYRHDTAPLTFVQSNQEEMGRRCVAISNIFRSLSCIPGNEIILSKHHSFILILGRLLMLHHWHPPRSKAQPATPLIQNEIKVDSDSKECTAEIMDTSHDDSDNEDWTTSPEWWWEVLETLRENVLVILANICSHMHMRDMDSDVCLPVLDGLLHWMVCPSSSACDPLPSVPSSSLLSPQRLVLEALCKLCIHEENVDLLLATPPFCRILRLMGRLMRLLSERNQPVPREFSIALMSRLVQRDAVVARAVALQRPSISLLIEFLETAEQSGMAVASQQGYSVVHNNPELMGTSQDMLHRAASTLLHMACVPENRKLFSQFQNRLLTLVMSQVLDSGITQTVSNVLYECSQYELSHT